MHVCARVLSVQLFATPWTVAHEAPLSMEFSRQEYWSGFPFPTSGDLPDPQFKLVSLVSSALASRFFNSVSPGKPLSHYSQLLSVWLIICQFTSLDSSLFAYKMRPVYQTPSNFNMLYSMAVKLLLMSRYSVLKVKLIWCYSVTLRVIFYDYSEY